MGSEISFISEKHVLSPSGTAAKIERARNKRYLIVCEGTKTEPNYLQELLDDLRIRPQVVRIARNEGVSLIALWRMH